MKRILAAAVAVGTLSACSTGTAVSTTPVNPSNSIPSSAAPSSTAPSVAHVGQTISLSGDNGVALEVTLVKVGLTSPNNSFDAPDPGKVLYAAQLRIKNTGSAVYSDTISNGAKVVDGSGQEFEASITAEGVTLGPSFSSSLNMPPGSTRLGVVAFQIPKGTKVAQIQWGMESGFGSVAQWNVP